ncbi:hypothetical protein LS48_12740 [Aequorivita aquimaris]|uniref:Uncharacterized protein n=1 Tax=Aequorivita aquimaris TaxID=1548749 RepID=A0A137RF50_9FLAO|nr:hypothetical protein LS48_12740 [Aequorivita aquimaris]
MKRGSIKDMIKKSKPIPKPKSKSKTMREYLEKLKKEMYFCRTSQRGADFSLEPVVVRGET